MRRERVWLIRVKRSLTLARSLSFLTEFDLCISPFIINRISNASKCNVRTYPSPVPHLRTLPRKTMALVRISAENEYNAAPYFQEGKTHLGHILRQL